MRCKPDQMAMVTRNTCGDICQVPLLDKCIITCDRALQLDDGPIIWLFKEGSVRCPLNSDCTIDYFLDEDLTPITPPSLDDMTDADKIEERIRELDTPKLQREFSR